MSHNDIYSIVQRLALIESDITPSSVDKGLNKQQKSVPQLPALFNPKHISVLANKTDPEHPMKGYAVGCEESDKHLEEEATTDVLSKVKASFTDYLKSLESDIKTDRDLLAKKKEDLDLKKKEMKDLELQIKAKKEQEELEEDPTQEIDAEGTGELTNTTYGESLNPVKTVQIDGLLECGIYGDEDQGFEIRRGEQSLPSRFNKLSDAETALELYKARRTAKQSQAANADYVEEK